MTSGDLHGFPARATSDGFKDAMRQLVESDECFVVDPRPRHLPLVVLEADYLRLNERCGNDGFGVQFVRLSDGHMCSWWMETSILCRFSTPDLRTIPVD